jgi:hypothetical protein
VHTAHFHYDAAGLDLTLDGLSIFTDVAIPLAEGTDGTGNSWAGFGARCGDAYENQDILSWSFQTIPEPSSIAIGVLGLFPVRNLQEDSPPNARNPSLETHHLNLDNDASFSFTPQLRPIRPFPVGWPTQSHNSAAVAPLPPGCVRGITPCSRPVRFTHPSLTKTALLMLS